MPPSFSLRVRCLFLTHLANLCIHLSLIKVGTHLSKRRAGKQNSFCAKPFRSRFSSRKVFSWEFHPKTFRDFILKGQSDSYILIRRHQNHPLLLSKKKLAESRLASSMIQSTNLVPHNWNLSKAILAHQHKKVLLSCPWWQQPNLIFFWPRRKKRPKTASFFAENGTRHTGISSLLLGIGIPSFCVPSYLVDTNLIKSVPSSSSCSLFFGGWWPQFVFYVSSGLGKPHEAKVNIWVGFVWASLLMKNFHRFLGTTFEARPYFCTFLSLFWVLELMIQPI